MGVAVGEVGARGEQRAGLTQVRANRSVGRVELVVDDRALAAAPQPLAAGHSARIHRGHWLDACRFAQLEIVLAVIRSYVDQARALIGGDEIAGEKWTRLGEDPAELVHRVLAGSPMQFTSKKR